MWLRLCAAGRLGPRTVQDSQEGATAQPSVNELLSAYIDELDEDDPASEELLGNLCDELAQEVIAGCSQEV